MPFHKAITEIMFSLQAEPYDIYVHGFPLAMYYDHLILKKIPVILHEIRLMTTKKCHFDSIVTQIRRAISGSKAMNSPQLFVQRAPIFDNFNAWRVVLTVKMRNCSVVIHVDAPMGDSIFPDFFTSQCTLLLTKPAKGSDKRIQLRSMLLPSNWHENDECVFKIIGRNLFETLPLGLKSNFKTIMTQGIFDLTMAKHLVMKQTFCLVYAFNSWVTLQKPNEKQLKEKYMSHCNVKKISDPVLYRHMYIDYVTAILLARGIEILLNGYTIYNFLPATTVVDGICHYFCAGCKTFKKLSSILLTMYLQGKPLDRCHYLCFHKKMQLFPVFSIELNI